MARGYNLHKSIGKHMKIAHESPLSLLEQSRVYNDYDYALVHLFEEKPEYYNFFEESLKQGRHVILDNSIFELGTAFDPIKYTYWISKLKPTEYIIPDVLEDALGTMDNALDWKENQFEALHKGDNPLAPNSKSIGVVQGKSYEELVQCYQYLDEVIGVDKLAISFDYSYYLEICPHPNKWMGFTNGRVQTLSRLLKDGIINKNKPHHLLGCALPIEFLFYREGFDWIETIDTSSPIVHGLLNVIYEPGGLVSKQSIKLVDLINSNPTTEQIEKIAANLAYFRSYVKGLIA